MNNFNNPFKKVLEGFKAEKVEKVPEESIKEIPIEFLTLTPENEKEVPIKYIGEKLPWRHPDTGLLKEDQELFENLCQLIDLKNSGITARRYREVSNIVASSRDREVSSDVKRWLDGSLHPGRFPESHESVEVKQQFWKKIDNLEKAKKIIDFILKRGYEADVMRWLRSRTPENMKYGSATREERLQFAKQSAKKAEKTIEEIAQANGLEDLLK